MSKCKENTQIHYGNPQMAQGLIHFNIYTSPIKNRVRKGTRRVEPTADSHFYETVPPTLRRIRSNYKCCRLSLESIRMVSTKFDGTVRTCIFQGSHVFGG